jgi:hypothetical protein
LPPPPFYPLSPPLLSLFLSPRLPLPPRLSPLSSPHPQVTVYYMKPKKHTRKKNGYRSDLTKFLVTSINV